MQQSSPALDIVVAGVGMAVVLVAVLLQLQHWCALHHWCGPDHGARTTLIAGAAVVGFLHSAIGRHPLL